MRTLRLALACAFFCSLFCGCGGEENRTNTRNVTVDSAKMGSGKQRNIQDPGAPSIN
jgi:hypothetical protein